MLLFFLLVGRTLDHLMRERARGALGNLERLAPRGATRIHADGTLAFIAIDRIVPGMTLLVRAGDRLPVDCIVAQGTGEVDASLVTGESLPVTVSPGSRLAAGTINSTGSLEVEVEKRAGESFLARMITLMSEAEGARTRYRRIADRVAAIYAPVLHTTAALTFLGWGLFTGDWHGALVNAVAVLIITCPCALALAVPMVQVVAAARLFRNGIMMRDGAGLERAARVGAVIFDKTGTLTEGTPRLERQNFGTPDLLGVAAAIAAHSTHPLAQALARSVGSARPMRGDVREHAGAGVEVRDGAMLWRLGNAKFCDAPDEPADIAGSRVYLSRNGEAVAGFSFEDKLRADAPEAAEQLRRRGLDLEILSGDAPGVVARVAAHLSIASWHARQSPQDKLDRIAARTAAGERLMMVGDGINDAPALRAASVSMAPSEAADIGRNAADFVFTSGKLASVPFLFDIARRAERLVVENLSLAVIYNAIALPLAIAGLVTPLIAALAMSGSSLLVVANAMRLNLGAPARHPAPGMRPALAEAAA
jgi:Cu2+-exporting ATPase